MGLGTLAWAALRQADYQRARMLLSESLTLRKELGDKGGIAWCLEKEAEMAAAEGNWERAVRLLGIANSLRASVNAAIDLADQPEHQRRLGALRAQLGEPAFAAAWDEGRAMTVEQAITYALEATQTTG